MFMFSCSNVSFALLIFVPFPIPIPHSLIPRIRGQFVHMLVDVSEPRAHGKQFADVFMNRQDTYSTESFHRMIIRSIPTSRLRHVIVT